MHWPPGWRPCPDCNAVRQLLLIATLNLGHNCIRRSCCLLPPPVCGPTCLPPPTVVPEASAESVCRSICWCSGPTMSSTAPRYAGRPAQPWPRCSAWIWCWREGGCDDGRDWDRRGQPYRSCALYALPPGRPLAESERGPQFSSFSQGFLPGARPVAKPVPFQSMSEYLLCLHMTCISVPYRHCLACPAKYL